MPLVRKESPEEVIVRISPSRNTVVFCVLESYEVYQQGQQAA